jgi:hypothetical protein
MQKILSMNIGSSNLNLIVDATTTGILLTGADLKRIASMLYNGSVSVHKIEGMATGTRVLKVQAGSSNPAHLSFVTEQHSGTVLIGNDDMNRIASYLRGVSSNYKLGVLEMPRLAA